MRMNLSTLTSAVLGLAFVVLGLGAGLLLRRTLLARLVRLSAATPQGSDDYLVKALRSPVVVWCTLLGMYLAAQVITLPSSVALVLQRGLLVVGIVSVTWAVARIVGGLVDHATSEADGRLPSATFLTNMARLGVLGLGMLVVLQTMSISITPLLTALGIGGLAIGLALQDTLANFFAGLHILTSRQVRRGDYVKLSSGEAGRVEDVTWRYTTMRQDSNNLTVVPNSKLASAVVTNYTLPDPELVVPVPVGVSYLSDLERVEDVTAAVGREVMEEVPGGVPEFEPFIRYTAFGQSRIEFTVMLRGREIGDQDLLRHEFMKRLYQRYQDEGIEIPFKVQTVNVRQAEAVGDRP